MSGVLFIVTIPTEREEYRLHSVNECKFGVSSEAPSTSSNNSDNVHYGIAKVENCSSEDDLLPKNDSVTIDISGPSPKSHQMLHTYDEILIQTQNTDQGAKSTLKAKSTPNMVSLEPKTFKKSWDGFKHIVTSSRKSKTQKDIKNSDNILNLPNDSTMEYIMTELFKILRINNAIWQMSKNTSYYQITFSIESSYRQEFVLNTLSEWGIGERCGSCLSMIPCAIYNQPKSDENDANQIDSEAEKIYQQKHTAWERFMNSMQARWNVAQIVQRVKADATLTFDFVSLVVIAGILASFGLVENSTTFLASSMLISPLMGPIIATIFGIVIKDGSLIRFGFKNEVIGILLATSVGFLFGMIFCSIDEKYAYGPGDALTEEMISRCEFHSLLVGVFTALPSGAAVAIAILGGNIGSLVGVAISASLLPPAINSGVLWALAILYTFHEKNVELYHKVITTNYYSNNQAIELAVHGCISMLLTVVNIICILLMGVLVLKIKEVAPITARNQGQLWKHDIKVARDFNKSHNPTEDPITQKIADELKEMHSTNQLNRKLSNESYQNTWSPMTTRFPSQCLITKDRKSSVADLEKMSFYNHLTNPSNRLNIGLPRPKYQTLFDHSLFPLNGENRRASMPLINTASNPMNIPTMKTFDSKQLEKIVEASSPTSPTSPLLPNASKSVNKSYTDNEWNTTKSPKFTVTPSPTDPIHDYLKNVTFK